MLDEQTKLALKDTWKKARSLLPIELILAIGAAIAIFSHYDAKSEAQEKAISALVDENKERDKKIEATRLEVKRDQESLHNELGNKLEKISDDIETIKMTQMRICFSNKIKCQ